MSDVKLITTEEGYLLEVSGERSEVMDYGEPLEFKGYLAHVDLPEGKDESEDVENVLPEAWVYKVSPLSDVEPEEDDEDDDDDDEDNEPAEGADADVTIEASGPDGQYEEEDEDDDEDEEEGII